MPLNQTELNNNVEEIINNHAKGLTKNCARNAIRHIEKSWEIKDIDPEMALFRAITAEEEAATAIFIALKEKGYDNSNKLLFKKHLYKQALAPFVRAIAKFIAESSQQPDFPFGHDFNLVVSPKNKPEKLKLSFILPNGLQATPIPPLHFSISMNGKLYNFDTELTAITSGQNQKEVINYVKELANLRNLLLFASPKGIPVIEGSVDADLQKRKNTVFTFLRLLCLIFPYREKAQFVQQALNAFLEMLGRIEEKVENQEELNFSNPKLFMQVQHKTS